VRQVRALCLVVMRRSMALCLFAAMPFLGCSDAPQTVQGGEPLTVDPCAPNGSHSGNRWQDLYACYFGPSGTASCGSQGTSCHATAKSLGAVIGLNLAYKFVCGPTPGACWQGLIDSMAVPAGGAADPTSTVFYSALRKGPQGPNDPPQMPLNSPYTFSPAALAQISAWIQQGAKNN